MSKIRAEAEAFYKILRKVDDGAVSVVASGVLDEETDEIKAWLEYLRT